MTKAKSTSEAFLVTATERSTARTEAPTLTAGRELDALIAEKVFGAAWESFKLDGYSDQMTARLFGKSPNDWILVERYTKRPTWYNATMLPNYSTKIGVAWQVMDVIQTQHPGWRFSLMGGDVVNGNAFGWHAQFFGDDDPTNNNRDLRGESPFVNSAPLAICLAALSVLSQTEEGK